VKFAANVHDLAIAAGFAARAIERKLKIAILNDLLLEAADDKISLVGTDMDTMARVECAASVEGPGAVAMPAVPLAQLLDKLDSQATVTIEALDHAAAIKCGRSRYKLPTLPASDFPAALAASPGPDVFGFTLTPSDVRRLFVQPAFAVCTEPTRYYLCGLFLTSIDGRLASVATDGRRLVRVVSDVAAPELGGVIPPGAACAEIARLAKGNITLCIGRKIIEAHTGSYRFSSKLIDGSFPDYERVIPPPSPHTFECDRAALLGALARAAAVAEDKGKLPAIRLEWRADALRLTLADESAHDEIDAGGGRPGWVGVSLRLLTGLLGALDGERVLFDAADPHLPIRVSVVGDADLLALLMPMQMPTMQEAA
jgi:DNA polymerase-3 subunit beta